MDHYGFKDVGKIKKRDYPKFTIIVPKRTADTENFFTERLREQEASKARLAENMKILEEGEELAEYPPSSSESQDDMPDNAYKPNK